MQGRWNPPRFCQINPILVEDVGLSPHHFCSPLFNGFSALSLALNSFGPSCVKQILSGCCSLNIENHFSPEEKQSQSVCHVSTSSKLTRLLALYIFFKTSCQYFSLYYKIFNFRGNTKKNCMVPYVKPMKIAPKSLHIYHARLGLMLSHTQKERT